MRAALSNSKRKIVAQPARLCYTKTCLAPARLLERTTTMAAAGFTPRPVVYVAISCEPVSSCGFTFPRKDFPRQNKALQSRQWGLCEFAVHVRDRVHFIIAPSRPARSVLVHIHPSSRALCSDGLRAGFRPWLHFPILLSGKIHLRSCMRARGCCCAAV
jgi:hypothetical protein